VKKIAKNVAQTIFLSKLICNLHFRKRWRKVLGYFCDIQITAQSKQSSIGRNFTQSGHPARNVVSMSYILEYIQLAGKAPGLPDGIFSSQKCQFGEFLVGLAIEDVGMFYIWSIGKI
jgi:hypothetical protein